MTLKAIVLGCGRIGAAIAKDLASDRTGQHTPMFEVTAADLNEDNLGKLEGLSNVTTIQVDLGDPARLQGVIAEFDLVLGALPSTLGFQTLQTVIESKKPYCDISFMNADPQELNELAKSNGVTAVVDCGVSPGLSNMIIGYAHAHLDRTQRAEIYVGGLPKVRRWPYQYKAPFAPADVIEEYTRPARMVENGKVVFKAALSEPELIDFPRVGTLEAFNTDGLRTLLSTLEIANMKEKTLRYPGHCELMRVLRDTGFFGKEEIEVGGVKVRPLDLTSKLLFPRWTFEPGEEDFTVMRVLVEGRKNHNTVRYTYNLYDEYDRESDEFSMARTTAFPCAIVARMLVDGRLTEPGVFPPELLVRQKGIFDQILQALKARGIALATSIEDLPGPA